MALRVFAAETVSFGEEPATRVLLAIDGGVYFDNRVRVRAYPRADAIVATAGVLTYESDRVEAFRESLKFQGADSSQLKYPSADGLVLSTLDSVTVDANLNAFSPYFQYDANRDAVRVLNNAGVPVAAYGAVQADYISPYQRYFYRPQYSDGVLRYGSIIARFGKSVAVLPINDTIINNGGYVVFYEVVSPVLLDSSDLEANSILVSAWEVPPGWPDSTSYPGLSVSAPDAGVIVDERKHEIGYVNRSGRVEILELYVRREKPYVGVSSYYPDWRVVKRLDPPDGYAAAFAEIPWADLLNDVRDRYPGVTGT